MPPQSTQNGGVEIPSATIGSSLIPIINKIQDIIAPVGCELNNIPLPQVVVVGSQSSGKSSVLEALVGRDFIPRGCDICTRRPLVLMLENRPQKHEKDDREWGEFRHSPGKIFYDFSQIRQEIQAETEREVGVNKGVSGKQIRLKISSPRVLNMTLVDLPGITKVPVGDQPSDIESRIRKMIMSYITQENCIILAVSPANTDLATSDALQMAREVDPTGSRTIGVITKIDIMDRGTSACNFLLGKVIPLRLGYVGIVNRCQEDMNCKRSIQDALTLEEQFFRAHPVYNGLSDRCGIPQLAKKLNQVLEQHVKKVLPDLKAGLNSHMDVVVKELQKYGEVVESKGDRPLILLDLLQQYTDAFTAMMEGKSQQMMSEELFGGARIHYIFKSILAKSLEEVDPCEDLTDDDIRMAIQNGTGLRNALFAPEIPFEVLVRKQMARLLDPSLQCLNFVYDELIKMSRACATTELQRFPYLRQRLDEILINFLLDGKRPAESMIKSIIDMEMDYINSSHPNFIGGNKAVELAIQQMRSPQDCIDAENDSTTEKGFRPTNVLSRSVVNGGFLYQGLVQSNNDRFVSAGANPQSKGNWVISSMFRSRLLSKDDSARKVLHEANPDAEQSSSKIQLREPPSSLRPLELTENDAVEIVVTKLLLRSYYDIVRNNIQDLVPKAIMHFLVNHTKRGIHKTFVQKLYRENLFEELFREQDEVAKKRDHARDVFQVLQQAVQTLSEVESDVSCRYANSSLAEETTTTGLPRSSGYSKNFHSRTNGENMISSLS